MRRALIGSLIFHVALTIGFFQWIAFKQVKYVPRDVYTVKLVGNMSEAKAAAPKVQEAPPKPEPVVEEKVEEKEAQMPAPPDKPKAPKPKAEKKTTVPTTDIRKTDAKPDSSLAGKGEGIPGPPGDTPQMGSVSIDGGDFPFASYIARMRQKIATTWEVPPGTEGFERSALVYFRIHRNGSVSDVSVEKSSTLPIFDRSCQRAVMEAAPMPPLPREYGEEYIGVHFSFLYQPSQ
ncbi:MAG TPA: energy transducer TonB [Candidatus Krumholzibacteria bacterium]